MSTFWNSLAGAWPCLGKGGRASPIKAMGWEAWRVTGVQWKGDMRVQAKGVVGAEAPGASWSLTERKPGAGKWGGGGG